MRFCPCGKLRSFCWRTGWVPALLSTILGIVPQLGHLHAQEPSSQSELIFTESEIGPVQEGYFTLSWSPVDQPVEYVLSDSDKNVVYRCVLPEAFVSGLADGTYAYSIKAIDANGDVVAESMQPAQVTVEHWPLWYALALFACGLVVFLSVVVVIVQGSLHSRQFHRSKDVTAPVGQGDADG